MFVIENGIIKITRGDSATIEVELRTLDDEEYAMKEGDTLILTVRKEPNEESEIITEIISDSNVLTIKNEDTAGAVPEKYSCDIQLTTKGGDRYTFFGANSSANTVQDKFDNFWILPEVTMI